MSNELLTKWNELEAMRMSSDKFGDLPLTEQMDLLGAVARKLAEIAALQRQAAGRDTAKLLGNRGRGRERFVQHELMPHNGTEASSWRPNFSLS